MDQLDILESQSVYILREAYREFKDLVMLWSIGKDSTVLLWLARKAFFGHVPIPLLHIDTEYKIPAMIEYRDRVAMEWELNMTYGRNSEALDSGQSFPNGNLTRLQCCRALKSEALKHTLSGDWPRWALNHETGQYDKTAGGKPYTGVIVGVRSDEEGSRSKERYFSPRDDRGEGKRYRSLGCAPCTSPVESTASNVREIIEELQSGKFADIAERSGREQDKEDGQGLETLRRDGYM